MLNSVSDIPKKRIVIILFILFTQNCTAQQDLRFEHITIQDGLPEISVRKSLQDYQGFLWLATQNGLARYDGYFFKVYKPERDDNSSIDASLIHCIYEDRTRDLWIGTINGLSRYNREKDEFENDILFTSKPEDFIEQVSICEDDSGYLYVGLAKGGFFKYDKFHKTVKKYLHSQDDTNSISSNNIRCLYFEKPGVIWIGTWGAGLERFDIEKQTFKYYRNLTGNKNTISSNFLSAIYKDRSGNLWIGTNSGLNKFDKFTESFTSYDIYPGDPVEQNEDMINSLYEDNYGFLWVGTSGAGLFKFYYNRNSFIQYKNEPGNKSSLSTNWVKDIYEDRSEILWIGNMWGGLNKYDRETVKFVNYKNDINDKNSLTGGLVGGIIEDKSGTIWIGTEQGFNKFDYKRGRFTRYEIIFGKVNTMSKDYVRTLYKDSRGTIWIGTRDGLVNFGNNNRVIKIYKHDKADSNSISSSDVTFIYEDKTNDLWIGTIYGLNRFDKEKDIFIHYFHLKSDSNSISDNGITCIYEDRAGEFWVGTNIGGLNLFNRNNGIFKSYYFNSGISTITATYEDNQSRFWVTDYFAGLSLFDRNTGNFKQYTEDEGLANNCAGGIVEDNKGNLWIGTASGLSKFNPETKIFKNYKTSDGLLTTNLYWGANLKDKNGFIYFGGEDGFVKFHPDSLMDNPYLPPVVLTDFKIFSKSVKPSQNGPLKKNINVAEEITLSYGENNFSFEFAALDYRNPGRNQYAYLMEGFDKDWIQSGNVRTAFYTNLDPGEYVFRVKGSNNDGVWNEKGVSVKIIITPPWWKTLWFRGCGIILVIGLLGYVRQKKLSKMRYEMKRKEDFTRQLIDSQEQERKRIAGELHDSLGQNLLMVKNRTILSLKDKELNDNIRDSLNEISGLTSEALTDIRAISYNLRPYELDRIGLTKTIESLIEKVEKSTSIKFRTEINEIDDMFPQESEIIIYRIIQECINNIIKHSGANEAGIRINRNVSNVIININDTGKGFDLSKSEAKGGFGLKGMMERVNLIRGNIKIESLIGKGTSVQIILPYLN